MKTIKENDRYRLVKTEGIEYVGNYQVLDLIGNDSERHMPFIFDDLEEALYQFYKLSSP